MCRALLIFLVLVNAAAPTLAGFCATHCAGGAMSAMSVPADEMPADCHEQPLPDTNTPDAPASDEDSSAMQAACAIAGTPAVLSAVIQIERTSSTEPIDPPARRHASWQSFPPEHPPRAFTS